MEEIGDDAPIVIMEDSQIKRRKKMAKDTRGMSLEDLSDYGIVSSTILARLRETHNVGRTIVALKLFGDDADVRIKDGDSPVVQLFKEHAKLYRKAEQEDDTKAMRDVLADMTKLTLGWQSREESTLTQAVKIQIEAARLRLKNKDAGGYTEAELAEAAGEANG